MGAFRLFPGAPALAPISLGSSTFAREIDQAAAFDLLDGGLERGITWIDTAATYSAGASEEIIGAWLASRRPDPARLSVSTKIYPPYTPRAIDQAAAASARRLGVATLDLLYLHKWDPAAESPAALMALDALVRSGRARALGLSNATFAQLRSALSVQARLGLSPFRVLQNNNNVALRDVDSDLRTLCADAGVAIVTYSPLGAGFLTGKHRAGVVPGSRFDVAPAHRDLYFTPEVARRLARLEDLSVRTGLPMAHLALAWALHQPGVASVLVGGRSPAHLDQAFTALALHDPSLLSELDAP